MGNGEFVNYLQYQMKSAGKKQKQENIANLASTGLCFVHQLAQMLINVC